MPTEPRKSRQFHDSSSRAGRIPLQLRRLRALDLPAMFGRQGRLLQLTAGSVLADVRLAHLEVVYSGVFAGAAYRVHLYRDRASDVDGPNVWLRALATRLGVSVEEVAGWRPVGDALVTGVGPSGIDASVPDAVVDDARRSGILAVEPVPAVDRMELLDPDAELSWVDGELAIPVWVALRSGGRVRVVIWVREDSIALEYRPGTLLGIDRETFQLWMSYPIGALMPFGLAGFTVRPNATGVEIGLKIPGSMICPLPDRVLALLREWVL